MVVIAVAIVVSMGFPVVLRQPRPGLRGRLFTLYKFRTMRDTRDAAGNLLQDEDRLTPIGRFLRQTSLDELPELVNVLRGDMSLVGPRPLLPQYLDRYTPEQARRHDVLPGITGWAQVNGRNALTWEEKFELDVWYVDNWSLALDLQDPLDDPDAGSERAKASAPKGMRRCPSSWARLQRMTEPMVDFVIVGTGGQAREIHALLEA